MSLTPGTRLGPFEVVAPIGAVGPAVAGGDLTFELWRGVAEAQEKP